MKIRLPAFLKDELSKYAKNLGISMNKAIVDLLQEALADRPSGYNKSKVTNIDAKSDLEKEIDFLWTRIIILNEDVANFASSLHSADVHAEHYNSYKSFLIKRISDTDLESEELYKKVKILEARLQSLKKPQDDDSLPVE